MCGGSYLLSTQGCCVFPLSTSCKKSTLKGIKQRRWAKVKWEKGSEGCQIKMQECREGRHDAWYVFKMMDLSQPFSYMQPRSQNSCPSLLYPPIPVIPSMWISSPLLLWICSHHWPYVGKLVLSNINGAFVLNICCLLLLIAVFFVSHDSTRSSLGFSFVLVFGF